MAGAVRLSALASSAAFAVLCSVLAGIGAIPWIDAAWASAAVVLAFVPSGWWAGFGVRRRAAEAALIPAAFAVTMVGSTAMRRMVLPPLLLLAAWAVVAAAWEKTPSGRRPVLAVFLGLSARAAVGLGLTGYGVGSCVLAFAVAAIAPWAVFRISGRRAAELAVLVAAVVPWQRWPVAGALVIVVCLLSGGLGRQRDRDGLLSGWVAGIGGAALLAASLAAWPVFGGTELFVEVGWIVRAALVAVLLLTPRLRPGVAGAMWFAVALFLGPALGPTPEHRAFDLTHDLGEWKMPGGTDAPYVIDFELRGKTAVDEGTPLAIVSVDGTDHLILSGRSEGTLVWRPQGLGRHSAWRPSVRHHLPVTAGERPTLRRFPGLEEGVTVRIITVGPSRATPPRDWSLPGWMVAAAVVVALVQLVGGTWRHPWAGLPWMVLVLGALVARLPVEPLRLVGERLSVDFALAAVMAAWLPAARGWMRQGKVFVTVVALLFPLAAATPHLTPSLYGDEPFHLVVMESLATDHDLQIGDDLDLENLPQNELYAPGWPLFQSPALALLLLPGYLLAGRTGALLLLTLMGGGAVSLLVRRARGLGIGETTIGLLVLLTAATYPLATFATQIWSELLGVLAIAVLLVVAGRTRGGRLAALFVAAVSVAVKTRLALLTFPVAAVVWLRRSPLRGLVMVAVAAGSGLAVGWLTMGHPFGPYRRLFHLLPQDPVLALEVLGGLAFDPAGGLVFTAPLLLAATAGFAMLWRRGGPGERALLVGCGMTVAALLHSLEWYGGGAPPARYLVPMLPVFFLAGGMVLTRPLRWRRMVEILLPPSLIAWWVLVTRPHLSVNPGDGGFWLADALSRRFAVDGRAAFPSFLVPNTATVVVPVTIVVAVAVVVFAVTRAPRLGLVLRRSSIALWLAAAAAVVLFGDLRNDRVVEFEAPQVRRMGGSQVPRAGTVSRSQHRRGWRLDNGNAVAVPLRLGEESQVTLEGWLLGTARKRSELQVRWDDGEVAVLRWQGENPPERVVLPAAPSAGRHRLTISFEGPPEGAVVLDRLVIEPGGSR